MLGKAVFRDFYRIFSCALFALVFVVFSLFSAWAEDTITYPFSITTTTLSDKTFSFQMSAKGTFYVDCDGGTLSGPSGHVSGNASTGWTIDRSSTLTFDTYVCEYEDSTPKTIRFGGRATEYAVYGGGSSTPKKNIIPIGFASSGSKVAAIAGKLEPIFQYYGPNQSQHPIFYITFKDCVNLKQIPATLFDGYTSAVFEATFFGCSGLGTDPNIPEPIPETLFSGITSGKFEEMFANCTGLTHIPANLFADITTVQPGMFQGMFYKCSGLGTDSNISEPIPANLFSHITTGDTALFSSTFAECTGLTHIPQGLFDGIETGSEYMFWNTFNACFGFGTDPNIPEPIPANLFSHITTGAPSMFDSTFANCRNLTHIPSTLFSGITEGVSELFKWTFSGCYQLTSIPEDLFSNIRTSAASMFYGTFSGCVRLTSIPEDLFSNITTGAANMFEQTFAYCSALTSLPETLFANITSAAENMFRKTFLGDSNLTGFIPPTLFEELTPRENSYPVNMMSDVFTDTNVLTSCPAGYYQYITGYEDSWDSRVSCQLCPPGTTSIAGATSIDECVVVYNITYDCGDGSGNAPTINTTATGNTSFTPADNTCTPPTGAIFSGWLVSGTSDIKSAGVAFTWEYTEDKTFTAQWDCDNNGGYWWNADGSACEPGYEIELIDGSCFQWDTPPVPSKLYTIKTVGAYLDSARTKLMTPQVHGQGGQNPLDEIPTAIFTFIRDTTSNVPINPLTGNPYNVPSVGNFSITAYGNTFFPGAIDASRHITNQGASLAAAYTENKQWSAQWSCRSYDLTGETEIVPTIPGYDGGWYKNSNGSGNKISSVTCDFSDCDKSSTLYAKWTPITYNIVYELGNVGDWGAGAKHPASVDYDTAFEVSNPMSNNGYTFAGWAITGMDGVTHYYSESPIFVNNVYQSSTTQTSSGISLSGTKATHFMNLRSTSGTVTFTAQWVCVDGYYWNSNTSECVQGHTITLQQPESCTYEYNPSVPTVLYTIQNNGIYRDAERNQLMIQQNQNGGQYQIEMPTATCVIKRNFGNLPRNPVTNDLYEPTSSVTYDNLGTVSMSDITRTISATSFNFQNQEIMSNFCTHDCTYNAIDSDGYITAYGSALSAIDADMTWTLSMEPVSVTLNERPEVTGYDVAWYDNQSGEGDSITGTFCGWCNTPTEVYAIWTPQTRNVLYYKGAHASSTSIDIYQQTNGVTYDAPYTALAFDEAPISENMAAAQGYVFVGWTTDSTPTFDNNGNLNHEFTHVDHYQQSGGLFGGLQLYAAYKCDTDNGYRLVNGECVQEFTLTYDCGIASGGTWESSLSPYPENEPVTLLANPGAQCDASEMHRTFTRWNCDNATPDANNQFNMPSSNVICTAQWGCDNANNWWWNVDNTACVQGYTIQLKILPEYATPEPTYPTAPTTLYTIPTRGAYLDAARTLLMTKTSNPIQLPYLEFMLNFDTNTPVNPVNNTQYSVPNVDSINLAGWYHCFSHPNMTGGIYAGHGWSSSTCFIHNTPNNYTGTAIRNLTPTNRDGYLTNQGIYEAENQYQNQTWYINGKGWEGPYYADNPTLTGYTFVNWCTDPENTTSCFKGQVPDNVQNHIYYAHWTPNTYDVIYNPGAHAASGSTNYTDTDGAIYDSPYTPLSFGASPISDNMSAGTGYVFVGWTTDSTPTFTNGNLDNEYAGDTYWKRDSGLTLYAAYACDSEKGYHLVNGECVLNTYTVTYYSGNCDPNNVENLFGNTYSATDSNLAVSGQPYNVLSYTNTSLVGDNFGQMYSDNGFGVPYACASFHGWNDPNIQGTDIDYNNCFSEQNGLCTPVIQSYSYEDNLNLYAYCEWDTWNVAYYGCDGELIKTESLKFGDSFLVPSASDISGYTFNGWMFNNETLGKTFTADLCLKGQNLNLYANCKPNVYPVNLKWVADGDTYNQNPDTCDYGTSTISGISHPDIPGYTFTGWKVTNWE